MCTISSFSGLCTYLTCQLIPACHFSSLVQSSSHHWHYLQQTLTILYYGSPKTEPTLIVRLTAPTRQTTTMTDHPPSGGWPSPPDCEGHNGPMMPRDGTIDGSGSSLPANAVTTTRRTRCGRRNGRFASSIAWRRPARCCWRDR